jgi:hypothetical protein
MAATNGKGSKSMYTKLNNELIKQFMHTQVCRIYSQDGYCHATTELNTVLKQLCGFSQPQELSSALGPEENSFCLVSVGSVRDLCSSQCADALSITDH